MNRRFGLFAVKLGDEEALKEAQLLKQLLELFNFRATVANGKITGVYNSYTYDAATGKVTDLSSYPLQRPAAN